MTELRERVERGLSVLLTLAGVVIAIALVRQEFFSRADAARPAAAASVPERVADWDSVLARGYRAGQVSGDSSARVQVMEFADLECPFCRKFHNTLRTVQQRTGSQVAHVFVHYPLPIHRFAIPAARASECASEQGRFGRFLDAVYAKQDSLGLKAWTSFAREAGVPDSAAFAACNARTDTLARVESGLGLGAKLGVRGTPTVIVNGLRFPTTPSDSQFARVVGDLIAGRNPFPSVRRR